MSTSTIDSYRNQQRRSALDHANEIRLARAQLRRRIASGEVFAASVILDPPAEARTWEVGELLLAQRQWGRIRLNRFLARACVSQVKPVGALTPPQRERVARALTESEDT